MYPIQNFCFKRSKLHLLGGIFFVFLFLYIGIALSKNIPLQIIKKAPTVIVDASCLLDVIFFLKAIAIYTKFSDKNITLKLPVDN